MLKKFLILNLRYRWLGFSFALIVALLAMSRGLNLPIRLSLADLLPENRESVLDLQSVSKEVGGVGYLIVLLGPMENPENAVSKVSEILKADPDVRYTYFEREEYSLKDKALYLMPIKEFEEVLESSRILLNDGKKGLLDLGLESAEDQKQNIRRAKARLKRIDAEGKDRFYRSEDGRYAMVLAKPAFDSEDLGKSRVLVDRTQARLKTAFGDKVPFFLVGRYVDKVVDTKQIETDIQFTSLLSLLGVSFVLIFGLGSLRAALLMVFAVSAAMAWTLGAAHLLVGQINILTGFLLAILGGMGVEYGVHLVRRFNQEVAAGQSAAEALELSYLYTGRALGSAAITSASAFLILSFSDFRGFSELGKIAGFGIISIYLVYVLMFPVMAIFLKEKPRFGLYREAFGFYPYDKKMRWLVPPFFLLCLWGTSRAEFEFDFKRMHNLSAETQAQHKQVADLFGRSFTPAAILATSPSQAEALERWLRDPVRAEDVQNAVALRRLVPKDMKDRHDEIEHLSSRLARLSDKELREKTGMNPADIRRLVNTAPYGRADLPPQFRDAFGLSGNIVLAYPARDLDKADALRAFAKILTEARQKFPGVKVGSDVRIFAEILDHITHDGLIILLVFLAGAFVVMGLDFRNVMDALDLELQLIAGIFLLVALMGLVGERFSILNIAMVPAVLAAGVDMGVHVRHREREGFGALPSARFVAQAVHLSLLTTIAGFGALFFADAGMLKGIAWISVLGQFSMYLVCMVIWPIYRGEKVRV